ncbi:hypothetical protein NDU88_006481 [Pleurodeles waltl]|uniref:Uncharacterized protein n=1 Tax=Pleurodeles waltl TaxID=8319 RepID=A0AAV7L5Q7_PLEWA|nr:hypothetical protein NDU88_006481 [Pleurodeles waltl]
MRCRKGWEPKRQATLRAGARRGLSVRSAASPSEERTHNPRLRPCYTTFILITYARKAFSATSPEGSLRPCITRLRAGRASHPTLASDAISGDTWLASGFLLRTAGLGDYFRYRARAGCCSVLALLPVASGSPGGVVRSPLSSQERRTLAACALGAASGGARLAGSCSPLLALFCVRLALGTTSVTACVLGVVVCCRCFRLRAARREL